MEPKSLQSRRRTSGPFCSGSPWCRARCILKSQHLRDPWFIVDNSWHGSCPGTRLEGCSSHHPPLAYGRQANDPETLFSGTSLHTLCLWAWCSYLGRGPGCRGVFELDQGQALALGTPRRVRSYGWYLIRITWRWITGSVPPLWTTFNTFLKEN